MMPEIRQNINLVTVPKISDRTPQTQQGSAVAELQQISTKPLSRSQLKRDRKQRWRRERPEQLVLVATPSGLILATASELGLRGGVR